MERASLRKNGKPRKLKKGGWAGGKGEKMVRLRRKGRDPATIDLPGVISIEIVRHFFNFNCLVEFTVMEL